MQITITGRHTEIPQVLKKYAEEKIAHLEKYSKCLIEAHVIIDKQRERYIAEVNIVGSNMRITAKEENPDMHACIDQLVANAGNQIKRQREKIKTHKIKGFFKKVFSPSSFEQVDEKRGKSNIIKTKYDVAKPKSIDEAIAEMELFKTEYLVFRNASTDEINVVHKKNDGTVTQLEPEH